MGISKLGALFASNADAIRQQRFSESRDSEQRDIKKVGISQLRPRAESTGIASYSKPVTSSDAAIVSQSIRTSAQQNSVSSDSSRAERVQKLKDEVRSGSYRPDSEKVAVAVMKELA